MLNNGKSDEKSTSANGSNFYIELSGVAIAVFLGMFAYEFLKTYFLPELTIWESHFITIAFSTIIATLATFVILKRQKKLLDDISEKNNDYRIALEKIETTEKKFQEVFNQANDIISLNIMGKNAPGKFIEINRMGTTKLGYTRSEFLNITPKDIIVPEKWQDMLNFLPKQIEYGESNFETVILTKDGTRIPVEINIHIFNLHGKKVVLAVSRDITERKLAEKQIQQSLEEKDMLMKETHHRVKNNLMIMSSLLNLQSRYIKDKKALGIFKESQNRAKTMALIHERLYHSKNLKKIDFGDYIRTLANDLYHSYSDGSGRIKLNINVEDLLMDINTTIPLGLILNELVTNSLKHGFPDKKSGDIYIEFKLVDNTYILTVGDTGVGFSEELDYKNTDSLGLQLVNSLTGQIGGELELNTSNGTEFSIKFKEQEYG